MRWVVVTFFLLSSYVFADLRYIVETTPSHTNFDTSGTFTDISVDSGNLDDGYDSDVSVGFDFPFNGLTYGSITIDTNGRILLDVNDTEPNNDQLKKHSVEMGLYLYWDDLDASRYGKIKYQHIDAGSSNDRFVIWWDDVEKYCSSYNCYFSQNGHYSFQIVLYKDGRIRFRYKADDDADGSSATIGVKENDTYYDEHTYEDSNKLDRNKDILYTPTTIFGHIYEDSIGNSQMSASWLGKSNVNVSLYADSGSTLLNTSTTDSNGAYQFYAPVNETVYIVVDSKTVVSSQGFNGSSDQGDVWAEQTYGGIGAECAGNSSPRTTAGSCFGGRRGDESDDVSSLANAEHRIKITTSSSTHSYTDRDFGFSFNVVTSIRDGDDDTGADRSVQGSLRQFIQNANALDDANTMRFVPAVAKNETNWWKIELSADLDAIQDDDTDIDGIAYSFSNGTTVDNSNSGSVTVSVSTVGSGNDGQESTGDEHNLPNYEKKELEINGGDYKVFDIRGNDNIIKNLSIYNSNSPSIRVRGDRVWLDRLYIGSRADGSQPSSGDRVSRGLISESGADDVKLTKNYIAYTTHTSVMVSGTGEITENVLHSNALAAFNPDAITLEGNSGQHHVTVWYNYIDAAGGYGIESWVSGGGFDIQYNTVLNTGSVGSDELGGIRIFGKSSTVSHNIIKNTQGAGIAVVSKGDPTEKNIISRNVIYANAGLSIDLDNSGTSNPDGDGVTPNNGTLDSTKQNNDMDYPVITEATYDGSTLHIAGYVGSAAGQSTFGNAQLEVYIADDDGNNDGEVIAGDGNSTAHGEGKAFLFGCNADGSGNFDCDLSSGSVDRSALLTLTATLSSEGTSEFSANYPIHLLPDMHISKTSCVINDPVNNSTNPKRIPGATIRYAIEVQNTGLGPAEDSIADDNVSSDFDSTTIRNLQIQNGSCNCEGVSSASNNPVPPGTGNGTNPVKLSFGTVAAGTTKCGYFEVDIE